jgi:mono/diheme cytochrome c family protein
MRRVIPILIVLAIVLAGCGGSSGPDPLREGRSIYGNACSVCHGSRGQGGVGPALADVTRTWPRCSDHIEWVTLGSDRWKAIRGDTYGATDKPVKGGMPSHENSLSTEERRLVAAFERSEYGEVPTETALQECGVEAPPPRTSG